MTVFLVRHAESYKGEDLTDHEKTKIGLSGFGLMQARAVAKYFKRKSSIRKLYASPFVRTKETAEIISSFTHLPVEYKEELREFIASPYERSPEERNRLKRYARSNPEEIMLGEESFNDSVSRLKLFLNEVYDLGNGDICVVTHRMIVEGFLSEFFDINRGNYDWLKPASVTAINVLGTDNFELLFYNRRFFDTHLILETIKRRLHL